MMMMSIGICHRRSIRQRSAVLSIFLVAVAVVLSTAAALVVVVVTHHGDSSTKRCSHTPHYTPKIRSPLLSLTSMSSTPPSSSSFGTSLRLTPLDNNNDDPSDYSKKKQKSELDSLITKRQAIRQSKLANIKPNDDTPPIAEMSDEEILAMLAEKEKSNKGGTSPVSSSSSDAVTSQDDDDDRGGGSGGRGDGMPSLDIDALFSRDYVPDFKTKRSASFGSRGGELSSSTSSFGGEDTDDESSSDKNGEEESALFVDWTADFDDENEFHVPNRMGFTTVDWGNAKKGFVNGKLKKKDRKMGKFNQSDLKVSVP